MSDLDKFTETLKILPEETIRGIHDSAIVDGVVYMEDWQKLINFGIYSENISAQFVHEKVQIYFKELSSAATQVLGYLSEKISARDRDPKLKKVKLPKAISAHFEMLCECLLNRHEEFIYGATGFLVKTKPSDRKNKLNSVSFNKSTGIGFVNGKRFKFKDHQPEFRVFGELYERINQTIPKQRVQELIGRKVHDWTQEINSIVKKIRNRTGLNINELVQNNGNLTLIGEKEEIS